MQLPHISWLIFCRGTDPGTYFSVNSFSLQQFSLSLFHFFQCWINFTVFRTKSHVYIRRCQPFPNPDLHSGLSSHRLICWQWSCSLMHPWHELLRNTQAPAAPLRTGVKIPSGTLGLGERTFIRWERVLALLVKSAPEGGDTHSAVWRKVVVILQTSLSCCRFWCESLDTHSSALLCSSNRRGEIWGVRTLFTSAVWREGQQFLYSVVVLVFCNIHQEWQMYTVMMRHAENRPKLYVHLFFSPSLCVSISCFPRTEDPEAVIMQRIIIVVIYLSRYVIQSVSKLTTALWIGISFKGRLSSMCYKVLANKQATRSWNLLCIYSWAQQQAFFAPCSLYLCKPWKYFSGCSESRKKLSKNTRLS